MLRDGGRTTWVAHLGVTRPRSRARTSAPQLCTMTICSSSTVLTLTASAAAAPGVYNLYVWGLTMAGYAYVPLTLTVTAP